MKRVIVMTVTVSVVGAALAFALAATSDVASAQRNADGWGGRWRGGPGLLGRSFAGGLGDGAGRPALGRFVMEQAHDFMTLRDDLNLTEDQEAQLAEIRESSREALEPTMQAVADAKDALVDAVLAEATDEEAIRAAADALGQAIGDAAVGASSAVSEARQVLTPEQIATIQEFRAARVETRETRREEMREALEQFRERHQGE